MRRHVPKKTTGRKCAALRNGSDAMIIDESLRKEILKYKPEVKSIPGPNEGRIRELREAIRKGTLINNSVLRDTAQSLLNHLRGKSRF